MAPRQRSKGKKKEEVAEEQGEKDNDTHSVAGSHKSVPKDDDVEKERPSKTGAQPRSLRKYWFPDRNPDMDLVRTGYSHFHPSDLRVATLVLLPLFLLMMYAYLRIGWEEVQEVIVLFRANLLLVTGTSLLFALMLTAYVVTRETPVYMLDFSVFDPPDELKIPNQLFEDKTRRVKAFDDSAVEFQTKLLRRTGLGEETYFPPGIMQDEPECTFKNAREEALLVFTSLLDDLFAKTGLKPKDIDILVVNCSLFNPTPSLAAMIMNHYKMRSDVLSYNLAGMGCSAGVISLALAKDLLQANRNSTALVCSTENITQNWYRGKEKGMLISNTLFRLGGAAILLSNKFKDGFRSKYTLQHVVRTNLSADDDAYKSIYQEEDDEGVLGVRLSKKLVDVLGRGVKANLTTLGPLVLPIREQITFWVNMARRKYLGHKIKPYVPDFKQCFDYYCIHAGGRAVIDGLQNNFDLSDKDCEPSRATLYRYGNVSSASIWYELAYIERSFEVKRGETVWQIAFGSGFHANSAIWKANRSLVGTAAAQKAK